MKKLLILLLIVGCEETGLNTESLTDGTSVTDTLYVLNYDTLIVTNYDTTFVYDTLVVTNYDTIYFDDTIDCAGIEDGTASIDECGVCSGGTTELEVNYLKDECGICGGDNSSCSDVCGTPNGNNFHPIYQYSCIDLDVLKDIVNANPIIHGENHISFANSTIWNENGRLISLYYGYNDYIAIPASIPNLSFLEILRVESTNLNHLPIEIVSLSNLTELRLSQGDLTSIPSEIENLTNLTVLDLSYNQLSGLIPSEIGNLTNLTVLNLRYNQFSGEIPKSVCDLIESNNLDINYILPQTGELTDTLINTCD